MPVLVYCCETSRNQVWSVDGPGKEDKGESTAGSDDEVVRWGAEGGWSFCNTCEGLISDRRNKRSAGQFTVNLTCFL